MTMLRAISSGRPAWPGEGLAVDQTRAGLGLRFSRDGEARPSPGFWARLLASSGQAHAWEQVLFDEEAGTVLPANGLTSAGTGVDAWEVNGREAVPAGTLVWLYALASTCDEAGGQRRVYLFDLGAGTRVDETGQELDPAIVGNEEDGSDSADGGAWNIADQTDKRGVIVSLLTRVIYNSDGDQILYSFFRKLAFDANGHLTWISGETRRVVETPEECS